jgi:sugar lactone lactonase YvrE
MTMIKLISIALFFAAFQSGVLAQEPPLTKPIVTTIVASHTGAVGGVITDQLGYVYIADFMETVWRLDPTTQQLEKFGGGFYGASGNTFDQNGNLYQASFYGNSISRISRSGEVVTVVDKDLNGPVGMIFNQANELLVCNCNDQSIKKVDAAGAVTEFVKSSDFNCPNGIAKDEDDNIYVVSFSGSKIVRFTPEGEASVFADSQGGGLGHIARVKGVFYATSFQDNKVYRITSDGTITVFAGTGERGQKDGAGAAAMFSNPNGIYADSTGNFLYINDFIGDPNSNGTDRTPFSVRRLELPNLTKILTYHLDNDSIKAMQAAYHAFKADPATAGEDNDLEMSTLGWTYMGKDQLPQAVALLELNAATNPDSWRVHSILGAAYMKTDENEKAIEVLQRSIALNPDNVVAKGRLITLGALEAEG